MTAYREQRYTDAVDAMRRGLEQLPDSPGLNYNYACFATLAGETSDETFVHRRAGRRTLSTMYTASVPERRQEGS